MAEQKFTLDPKVPPELKKEVIFADGTTLEVLTIFARRQFVSGLNRDTFKFNFAESSYSLDKLYTIFNDIEKTKEIIIKDTTTNTVTGQSMVEEYHHYNYSMYVDLTVTDELETEETDISPTINSRIISITMAQKTYTEIKADENAEQMDLMVEVVSDMIGGAM